jgi:antibiotic biosynthesis monooxygenase (ABM) superfamily enzyme
LLFQERQQSTNDSKEEEFMIQVHVDMSVDPAKETQMLRDFQNDFKPAAAQFPGYMDVKIVKLRKAFVGHAPEGVNYRFVLRYESEELRQKWIASDIHQKVWGTIEQALRHKNYDILLFDEV